MMVDGVEIHTLAEIVTAHLMLTMRTVKGNQRQAAKALGLTRWSLSRKLKKYGIGVNGYPVVETAVSA